LGGEGAPLLVAASAQSVVVAGNGKAPSRVIGPFPGGPKVPPTPDGVLAADLNYDYRTDLLLAGAGGLTLLRQGEDGSFADVTAATKLPATLLKTPVCGQLSSTVVWVTGSSGVAMAISAPSSPATMATRRAVRWLLPIATPAVTALDASCPTWVSA